MAQCISFAGSCFNEHLWSSILVLWAGTFSDAVGAIIKTLWMPHPNKQRGGLDLEQKIKWKLLLPTLLLQKPPSIHDVKGCDLLLIVYNG
jgi:hypothetical protein